jgi:probable F420-dependent oxidoreductase
MRKEELMKFGVIAPIATDRIDFNKWNFQSALLETAKAAEALNFDSYWAFDGGIIRKYEPESPSAIEPLITIASLVHVVPNLKFGISVLALPKRHAFLVAKQVASLDLLSNGRFTLGIGIGGGEEEFDLLGADLKNRGAITDEAIEVLRLLWREPKASYAGKYHQFSDAMLLPKPIDDGPPIWIGGNSLPAIRRAAKYGDGWLPAVFNAEVFFDELSNGVKMLRDLTQGRPMPTVAAFIRTRVIVDGKPRPEPTVGNSSLSEPTLEGSPDEIVQVLKAYQEVGLDYLNCGFYAYQIDDLLDQMKIFAEQVMPHLSDTV